MTEKPLIIIDDDDDDRPNPVINRPNPFPDRNSPKSFPEVVGMTEEEAKIYLKRFGKNGYNRKDGGICRLRNRDYNRVCFELGDDGTIISIPRSG